MVLGGSLRHLPQLGFSHCVQMAFWIEGIIPICAMIALVASQPRYLRLGVWGNLAFDYDSPLRRGACIAPTYALNIHE